LPPTIHQDSDKTGGTLQAIQEWKLLKEAAARLSNFYLPLLRFASILSRNEIITAAKITKVALIICLSYSFNKWGSSKTNTGLIRQGLQGMITQIPPGIT